MNYIVSLIHILLDDAMIPNNNLHLGKSRYVFKNHIIKAVII